MFAIICDIFHYVKYQATVMESLGFYFEKEMHAELLCNGGNNERCYVRKRRGYHRLTVMMWAYSSALIHRHGGLSFREERQLTNTEMFRD